MKNGCSFSIFNFPLKMENGNNDMYTDQPAPSQRFVTLSPSINLKTYLLTYLLRYATTYFRFLTYLIFIRTQLAYPVTFRLFVWCIRAVFPKGYCCANKIEYGLSND